MDRNGNVVETIQSRAGSDGADAPLSPASARRPDLLFLTQRIPYPPTKGEKIRPFHVIEHLRRSFRIHLGTLIDDPADVAHGPTLAALCADTHFARLDPRRAKLRCATGLITGEPLSLPYFRDRGLARWVARVLAAVRPAAVFVFSSAMAQYVMDGLGGARVSIMDFADVDPEKWRAYAAETRGPMGWVYGREARLLLAHDRRVAARFDHSLFVSEPEAALFRRLAPEVAPRVAAMSNGVDATYFAPDPARPDLVGPDRPVFAFTGAMDYRPNIDAVVWFATAILPLIRAALPAARFVIVGARPTPEVERLAAEPGVIVTGRVPDVRPYLAHATAAVAPLRIARGIQNKVLEAMAMARPVVATGAALEGIEARAGVELLVADDARGFADHCLAIARGTALDSLGTAARRRVLDHYTWAAQLAVLDRLLAPALAPS
jgi:sugar transferase (PEP-CTERM/EpsH1 system associated)